jgi:hypothetical protein
MLNEEYAYQGIWFGMSTTYQANSGKDLQESIKSLLKKLRKCNH